MKNINLTKVISSLLVLIMIMTALPLTSTAGNGPRDHSGYIGFMCPEYNFDPEIPYRIFVYDAGMEVEQSENASYDLSSNTLTLNNFSLPMRLNVISMGDDFKIKLVGKNSLDSIILSDGQGNGCSVKFIGSGSLTLNENGDAEFALELEPCGGTRPTVTFASTVNVAMYKCGGNYGGIVKVGQALDDANDSPVFVFENGQKVNVDKQDSLLFVGDIEGYIINDMGGDYMPIGEQVSNPSDPDGLYTYTENWTQDPETGVWAPTEFAVQKVVEIIPGAYQIDYEYSGEVFNSKEALFAKYPLVTVLQPNEYASLLTNPYNRECHEGNAWIYTDGNGNNYVRADVYNVDEDENDYYDDYIEMFCTMTPLQVIDGEYVFDPITDWEEVGSEGNTYTVNDGTKDIVLTYTGEGVPGFTLGNDPDQGPGTKGYIVDRETPEGVKYTVSETHHIDESEDLDYYSFDVHKYYYSAEYDYWFQDFNFNETGSIEIPTDEFEDSEWNAYLFEETERAVEIKSYYDTEEFYGSICENESGDRVAIHRDEDLYDDDTVVYTFEETDSGVVLFTANEEFDKTGYNVVNDAVAIEGVHDYFIFGDSLKVSPSWDGASKEVNLSTITNTASGVKLTWEALSGAEKYLVYRKVANATSWTKLCEVTSTSITDSESNKSGTKYTYTVKAQKGSQYSKYNASGLSIIYLSSIKPTVDNAKAGTKISWAAVAGAKSYNVYRKTGSGSYAKIASGTNTSYVDKKAVSGTKYSYAVRAVNGASMGAYTGKDLVRLENPKFTLTPTAKGVTVKWSKVTGAQKYAIYRKIGSGQYTKVATIAGTTYNDTNVTSGKKYTYAVRAVNGSYMSAFNEASLVWLATPTFKLANSKNGPVVKINKVTGATGYIIYRKTASGSFKKIGTTKTLSYTDKTAVKNTKYTYAVRAYNGKYQSKFKQATITCKK